MGLEIHRLERKAELLQKKILEASQTLGQSRSDLQTWRDLRTELAIVEDTLENMKFQADYLRRQSNLGKRFLTRTFETFDGEENAGALEVCERYVLNKAYENECNGLIICGSYGTGKTHLAAAIANYMVEHGIPTLFDTCGGHLNKLKKEFNSKGKPKYLELMRNVEVLVIDDVGKEKQSEWSESVMFEIINHRYENLKPVIITSNFSDKELNAYFGDACYSRLIEMCNVVVTTGSDRRRKKNDINEKVQ